MCYIKVFRLSIKSNKSILACLACSSSFLMQYLLYSKDYIKNEEYDEELPV